jgi:hypothetical protein
MSWPSNSYNIQADCSMAASHAERPHSSLQLLDHNSIAASCDVPAVPCDVNCWPTGSPCKVLLQDPYRSYSCGLHDAHSCCCWLP